jgi:hypothetical protein
MTSASPLLCMILLLLACVDAGASASKSPSRDGAEQVQLPLRTTREELPPDGVPRVEIMLLGLVVKVTRPTNASPRS